MRRFLNSPNMVSSEKSDCVRDHLSISGDFGENSSYFDFTILQHKTVRIEAVWGEDCGGEYL